MADQIVRIMCPNLVCRAVLAVPVTSRGKTVKCRSCGVTIRVPEKQPKAPAGAPAPEDKKAKAAK